MSGETINISQGKVVQTVIDEYENVRAGRTFRDIFLTAPTGAGKSLLFQLPAFYISKKGDVTIVISPLIALMKDQVNAIHQQRGFSKAAYLNSEISLLDRDRIIEQCQSGEIDVLYMAPELLMSYDIRHFIGERRIGLMVIDEAHLITTWGRDFRVDYWYLGNKIRKIRKYSEHSFPMIAVTATAVYGGEKNDMVFDTAEESLMMHSPHYFIGRVKRDDIEFIISNYTSKAKDFDKHKLEQTTKTVTDINKLGFKTLVYAPYTSHVLKLSSLLNHDEDISVSYYGTLDALSKEQAEKQFRANDKNVMVCTKAFGMGVDIPDIQVVYHHAPSGLLPDYIQEIGRAARKTDIKGYAALNYSERDQKYSKQLYGMSALRLWQIKAVLKKIHDTYQNNGHKRNMLLSVDDFAFAFENDGDDIDQKVKTALMMIEKDYLIKYQFNVVLARPKQLFTKVYSKVSAVDLKTLQKEYPGTFEVL
jgi:RecQ family ATP-dependent DNA helicase